MNDLAVEDFDDDFDGQPDDNDDDYAEDSMSGERAHSKQVPAGTAQDGRMFSPVCRRSFWQDHVVHQTAICMHGLS